jgi:hypothetical protein
VISKSIALAGEVRQSGCFMKRYLALLALGAVAPHWIPGEGARVWVDEAVLELEMAEA